MTLPKTIYHLAEAANFASIQRHGLRCATQLMIDAGLHGAQRARLERTQRVTQITLPSGVQLRDQCPMPPAALEKCLVGLTPPDWYALINARVFLWLDADRLNRQRAACGTRAQVVLAIDAAALLDVYGEQVTLTPINTGNARRKAAPRGAATFVPYAKWLQSGWDSEAAALGTPARKRSQQPAEVTIAGVIPDVMRFVSGIHQLPSGKAFASAT